MAQNAGYDLYSSAPASGEEGDEKGSQSTVKSAIPGDLVEIDSATFFPDEVFAYFVRLFCEYCVIVLHFWPFCCSRDSELAFRLVGTIAFRQFWSQLNAHLMRPSKNTMHSRVWLLILLKRRKHTVV